MPHKHNAWQFCEGLNDVEVAQRTDLKESHAVLFCVSPCLLRWYLPLESKVKPIAHQDPGYTWGMLMETKILLLYSRNVILFHLLNRVSKSYSTSLTHSCTIGQWSFSGIKANRHRIGHRTGPISCISCICLSTPNGLNGITSSISRIQRSMPSKDQPLVISYTSKMPCRIKVKHSYIYKQKQNWGENCSLSPHLCSTRVRPEDGAESALSRCVPVEDRHASWPIIYMCVCRDCSYGWLDAA